MTFYSFFVVAMSDNKPYYILLIPIFLLFTSVKLFKIIRNQQAQDKPSNSRIILIVSVTLVILIIATWPGLIYIPELLSMGFNNVLELVTH